MRLKCGVKYDVAVLSYFLQQCQDETTVVVVVFVFT